MEQTITLNPFLAIMYFFEEPGFYKTPQANPGAAKADVKMVWDRLPEKVKRASDVGRVEQQMKVLGQRGIWRALSVSKLAYARDLFFDARLNAAANLL